jgi:hypothetical protein
MYRAVWRKRQGGFKQSRGGESQWGLVNVLVFFWLLFGFETKFPAYISIFKPKDDKCQNHTKVYKGAVIFLAWPNPKTWK